MRMEWFDENYNEPLYELRKYKKPTLRGYSELVMLKAEPKVESDRDMRQRYPGKTGEWPLNMTLVPITPLQASSPSPSSSSAHIRKHR